MKKIVLFLLLLTTFVFGANQCIVCHKGIEDIRDRDSEMMQAILKVANEAGHEGNDCIVCHGGNPKSKSKKYAHKGTVKYFKTHRGPKEYYSAPASSLVNQNSCGVCHENQVASQKNSLMQTQEGKIQEAMWAFGKKEAYVHPNGRYKTKNPEDLHLRLGTKEYQEYMEKLSALEPQVFPHEIEKLPSSPTDKELQKDPSLAVYTYLHQESASHSEEKGCASCHVPYSKSGDMLVHSIQSSRKVKVNVHDAKYSGMAAGSCVTCHSSGKSIALSYQGLMQNGHSKLPEKSYLHMKADIHFQKGMQCQDCHTSNDMHGDGFLRGANLAAVEIECQDCHGTTKQYPWELPLGYSDEFQTTLKDGEPRGVAQDVATYLKQGYLPKKKHDGYIIMARGNPLPKAVKYGNKILIHLASGKDIELKPLKLLKKEKRLSKKALAAMDSITAHSDTMECYACHASWAPQYYGNHVKIDYSAIKKNRVSESSSYVRWEEPILGQNGEGRIAPLVPGYQISATVVGKDGTRVLQNHIFKYEKKNALNMSPVQPHTITKESRSCESCHSSQKALGLGIDGILHPTIKNLKHDFSQIIDANGTELMSVGTHFRLSGALSKEQRDKVDRRGVCLSCHETIPNGNLAVSAMTHIAQMSELSVDNKEHQSIVTRILNLSALIQVLGVVLVLLVLIYLLYTLFIKKKSINPRNRGWK